MKVLRKNNWGEVLSSRESIEGAEEMWFAEDVRGERHAIIYYFLPRSSCSSMLRSYVTYVAAELFAL